MLQFTNVFLNELLLLLKFDIYLLNVLLLLVLVLLLVIEEYLEMYGGLVDMFDIGVIVLDNDVNKFDDVEDVSVLYEL